MRWQMGRRSDNVQDRRGTRPGVAVGGGGGLLALALVVFLLGGDPSQLLVEGVQREIQYRGQPVTTQSQLEEMDFVSSVLGNTEDIWGKLLPDVYENPKLVVYAGSVESGCGIGQSAMGPFYCPNDQNVYLDLSFFEDMSKDLNAPGDFARAYVIAHEIGHHVQTLLGAQRIADSMRQRVGTKGADGVSVRMELQADCYAGIWAHYAAADYDMLEEGDIEEALNAASQIGDDRLQKRSQGYAVPDSFTHGTSKQRYTWFKNGFNLGQLDRCDTFNIKLQ